jgi:Spy/CpxP family protein refolding chaperone
VKLSPRGLLITALVALAAGFSGVWLGMRMFGPGPTTPSLHELVHERLNLSAEQRIRIETLEETFAARKSAIKLEMRTANAELAAAIREERGYGPRVTAAVEHFHDAMGRLQTATIAHVFAMREVLDEEQRAAFDDTVVGALTADPQ